MRVETFFKKLNTRIKSKPKVFVIGLNKTGTTTLKTTLWELGYSIGDQKEGELLLKHWELGFQRKLKGYCTTSEAFQDLPFSIPEVYKKLYEWFGDAKFILTTRDNLEQQFNSLCNFHSKIFNENEGLPSAEKLKQAQYRYTGFAYNSFKVLFGTDDKDLYNRNALITKYENHNADARNFFKENQNSFVEINVSNHEDYLKLCNFLSKAPKRDGFLWENKT